jgi:hypothetical protein
LQTLQDAWTKAQTHGRQASGELLRTLLKASEAHGLTILTLTSTLRQFLHRYARGFVPGWVRGHGGESSMKFTVENDWITDLFGDHQSA